MSEITFHGQSRPSLTNCQHIEINCAIKVFIVFHDMHDIVVAGFATFSESPSPSPTHSDDDSEQYSDSDEENKRLLKNPTNQAPTKTRPEFKKYAVKDFRFLKVLGKGR